MGDFWHTLRVEWLKLKYYRTFWILLAIIVVCIPAFNYVVYDITDNSFPKINGKSLLGNPFSFPYVWRTVPYLAGILMFMPAILIITLFTNEYSFRTHRQNIIDGWSRSRFIISNSLKFLYSTLFVTGIVILTCLYFGFLTRKGDQPGNQLGTAPFHPVLFCGNARLLPDRCTDCHADPACRTGHGYFFSIYDCRAVRRGYRQK